ncbi:hypothetical protein CDL15_Pgr000376 [Punica granatum]|uniref:60S ribosomal protein L27 n=3 Tax=Punica granatum TaxID=22663 RepID=A0A218XTK8_PUNGR|nr:hypothetical protein CDL15_Pgr000376 [Punica granatum]
MGPSPSGLRPTESPSPYQLRYKFWSSPSRNPSSSSSSSHPCTERRPRERARQEDRAKMVKFLKPNKAVIVLQGRYAGRKAVIVRSFDDGTRDRAYGHCLVAGIKKYPSKVIRKDSAKKTAKKSRVKCFVKLVNYRHLMPTRYTLDVDLKDIVTADCLQSKDKRVTASKETKKRFEERFKTGKNRWFFTKLRF